MERIRGEYDPRQLLLGLHLHGVSRRSTRRDNRYQTGLRLQHAGIELRHFTDAADGHLRLCRDRCTESRTGIYVGTSLFYLETIIITISMRVRLVRNDLTGEILTSESIEHLFLYVI